jgi:hypothetical protein
MIITKEFLQDKKACAAGMKWFQFLDEHEPHDHVQLLDALVAEEKYQWANWLLVHVMCRADKISYAVQVAEIFPRANKVNDIAFYMKSALNFIKNNDMKGLEFAACVENIEKKLTGLTYVDMLAPRAIMNLRGAIIQTDTANFDVHIYSITNLYPFAEFVFACEYKSATVDDYEYILKEKFFDLIEIGRKVLR